MLGEFFHWWGTQLLASVPPRLRQVAGSADAIVVDAGTAGLLLLSRRRRGVEQRLGQMRLDEPVPPAIRAALNGRPHAEAVVLRLPPNTALERSVVLPLAAERDPERVLGYEMERLTPFTADEVFWGWGIEERDRTRSRLVVRLTLIPRTALAQLIGLLAQIGARPGTLEAPTPSGTRLIALNHESQAGAGRFVSTRVLAGAVCALLAATIVSPYLRQSLELAELQSQIDSMAPQVRKAEALRRQISGAGAGNEAVAAETRRLGDGLEAIAAITDILPDDSYLNEFTMRERKMTLSGLSASAPRLISGLSADSRIRNPAFTAPVTKSETNHLDVFSIRAELAN